MLGWPGNQSQHFLLHHVLNTDRKAAECESFSQIDESFSLRDDVKKVVVLGGGTYNKQGEGGLVSDHNLWSKTTTFFVLLPYDPDAFKTC